MNKKPVIMISAAHDIDPVRHCEQYVLNKTYSLAVIAGGGIPVLPVDPALADEYVKIADGLVLTGGWPIHPANISSGAVTKEEQAKYMKEVRDPYDLKLYWAFRDAGKPIMGICRGHQMINIGQGGDLIYDLPGVFGTEHREGISHMIKTEPGSIVARLYGEEFLINSHHSYYVNKLGEGIKITAWSPEGVPEALEHETLPIFGLQWHPERMRGEMANPPKGPDMTKLFQYFANLCCQSETEKA